MLNAQLGNPLAYYGNIRLGFSIPQPYQWGAWKVKGHYQESPVEEWIEERVKEEPKLVVDNSELIERLKKQAIPKSEKKERLGKKPSLSYDDDEAFLMFM